LNASNKNRHEFGAFVLFELEFFLNLFFSRFSLTKFNPFYCALSQIFSLALVFPVANYQLPLVRKPFYQPGQTNYQPLTTTVVQKPPQIQKHRFKRTIINPPPPVVIPFTSPTKLTRCPLGPITTTLFPPLGSNQLA
jgi:hypothetical protein